MSESDAWEGFFKATFSKLEEWLRSPLKALRRAYDSQQAAKEYREWVQRTHGTTRILGKAKDVPLEGIFTDVYIYDRPQSLRVISATEMEQLQLQNDTSRGLKREAGLTLIQKSRHILILGKPGAGKTTFLKWVALSYAQDRMPDKAVPIYINLKQMADNNFTVVQEIVRIFEICNFPNPQEFLVGRLKAGNAIILLDGLDEVQYEGGKQEAVIADIRAFVEQYSKNRILLTCRVAAINYQWFDKFQYVEMADFTDEQIETYIEGYFSDDTERAEACLDELRHDQHEKLRDLARSPLLLTLLCLNYEESSKFPERRVQLYEYALDALLRRWDSQRLRLQRYEPYKALDLDRKKELYGRIAYTNFSQERIFFSNNDLVEQIESYVGLVPDIKQEEGQGEKVIRAMEAQHGVIVERAQDLHSFSHVTFQEYYTAKYIVENIAIDNLNELILHVDDSRWREVFLLTASLLSVSQANIFFEKFLTAIEVIITATPKLGLLLENIHVRSMLYLERTPLEARWWNLYFTRDRALALARTLAFNLDRALALVRTLNLDRALERALTRVHSLDRARTLAHAFDLDLDRARIRNLDRARTRTVDLNRALTLLDDRSRLDIIYITLGQGLWLTESILPFIESAIKAAQELNLPEMEIALGNLPIPLKDEQSLDDPVWETFRQQVRQIATTYWGIEWDLEFTEEDIETIEKYLDVTNLLAECLNLAVVSDREGIKNRLLMPPSVVGPG